MSDIEECLEDKVIQAEKKINGLKSLNNNLIKKIKLNNQPNKKPPYANTKQYSFPQDSMTSDTTQSDLIWYNGIAQNKHNLYNINTIKAKPSYNYTGSHLISNPISLEDIEYNSRIQAHIAGAVKHTKFMEDITDELGESGELDRAEADKAEVARLKQESEARLKEEADKAEAAILKEEVDKA